MLPRPEKSTLRLAGVRTAAGLGRPLSAFAIGPSGDFEELADCWVGAYGLATAGAVPAGWDTLGAVAAVHRQTFHLLSGSQNSPDSGVDGVHLVHHDHFTA